MHMSAMICLAASRGTRRGRAAGASVSARGAAPATAAGFFHVHTELNRPRVTRWLLWQEYKAAHPDGWQYSVFCEQYRRWLATQDPVLRLQHADLERFRLSVEPLAANRITISDEVPGRLVRAASLQELSRGPARCRVLRDIEMQHPSSVVRGSRSRAR